MADDEKSFRERVEEIRERREQEQKNDDSNIGQGIQANQQGNIQFPDMDQFLQQFGTELSGCRIIVETDDTRLEFHDQSLYKTHLDTGPMYQLIGEPDRKEPINSNTRDRDPESSTSTDSTTKVFTRGSSGASSGQHGSVSFCPGCGSDLGSFADVQHCPSCGREL